MNKAKLKSYAPAARRDFIQAVTDRAHFFGFSPAGCEPVKEEGAIVLIGGRPFPRTVAVQRRKLEERIKRDGFAQVMEAVAYTWFNRFLALRFMELHGYLDHGFRVLSNPNGGPIPEILDRIATVELPGLNKAKVVELKLDGDKDAELYRMLLVAQCNALHRALPFLFERIEDETELLLPDNLLHSDSLIRKLVTEIEEEDWQEVEIIGWLYQFYISEKKDQVIGAVVKSEDIPAATQLFTPNWIVKYMVQNSLGRKWLSTYPQSPLRQKMEYYIEPAEQTEEVNAQLRAITPESIDPETLTLLDPASGSGHILVEGYDLLKEIYLERGYSPREFPRLILEKNLYGLDIDDRAAQMAGFALLMKARKDDRRILQGDNPVKLNVMAIQGSAGLDAQQIAGSFKGLEGEVVELINLFQDGKTFGSLITVPETLGAKLTDLVHLAEESRTTGDMFVQDAVTALQPLAKQAMVLAGNYDCVVANPPYMGVKYYTNLLKIFINCFFDVAKGDLYTCFMVRNTVFSKNGGIVGMITIPNWMFLSSYEELRIFVLNSSAIESLSHNGRGVFGSDFGSCAFTFRHMFMPGYIGRYKRLFDKQGSIAVNEELDEQFRKVKYFEASAIDFHKIPGSPIAYWISKKIRNSFVHGKRLGELSEAKRGLSTGNNELYIRTWHEINFSTMATEGKNNKQLIYSKNWFPYNKGGNFRKWYGNNNLIVNWRNDGFDIKNQPEKLNGDRGWRATSSEYYFIDGITWCGLTCAEISFRWSDYGAIFDTNKGPMMFPFEDCNTTLGFLCSKMLGVYASILNPTLSIQNCEIDSIPVLWGKIDKKIINTIVSECVNIAKNDWNSNETSWSFSSFPMLGINLHSKTVAVSWQKWQIHSNAQFQRMRELEIENNRLFIETYELQDQLSPDVTEDQITLTLAYQQTDIKRLISYAIGCMMGRYSLEEPGLVYANSGNVGFDLTKYQTFPADDDGIVPIMDFGWFPDDVATRFEEFLKVAWTPETLEENLKFVADSLGTKGDENPRDTIRRYLCSQFYKDHLQTYKRRPIYWLFSSGKEKAFECLVYLHRYNEATLSRMRNEYLTPLIGKFSARETYLAEAVTSATSTAERNRLQKELTSLKKKQAELAVFDEKLRHFSDLRIALDLDDGVKVNYGKFGTLLAEVKAVTGGVE